MTAALQPDATHVPAASYEHALHCVAGFFASEPGAQAAAQQLRQLHGLRPQQGLLLGPAQASWWSFGRQARAWALGGHAEVSSGLSDAPLMAAFGGFVVALCTVLGFAIDGPPDEGLAVWLLLLGPVAGAAAGWMASALMASPAQQRRFNRHIRSQLAAGGWIVLAHHIPTQQQAGVADLLRERGVGWCAVYAPWRIL